MDSCFALFGARQQSVAKICNASPTANAHKLQNDPFTMFMCVGCWAGITYLRYTVLTSSKKGETAVHCCDPTLSVLVMLVSRNVFHVVSALQSIACLHSFSTTVSARSHSTLETTVRDKKYDPGNEVEEERDKG